MKQHIDGQQWNELSKVAQRKVEDLFNPETEPEWRWAIHYFQINIGWMIEFLEYHGKLGQILHLLTWTGATCVWRVTNEKGIPSQIDGRPDFKELCDALWREVKEELEK